MAHFSFVFIDGRFIGYAIFIAVEAQNNRGQHAGFCCILRAMASRGLFYAASSPSYRPTAVLFSDDGEAPLRFACALTGW